MQVRNMKQKSVPIHDFSMNPRIPIERSGFPVRMGFKAPISASYITPIFIEECMPGEMWNIRCDVVARTAIPIVPILDNWVMDFHFWFVPNRLVWENWVRFMGEQDNPADSISYVIPQIVSPANGFPVGSIYDYYGCGIVGQITAGNTQSVNALPFRGYNLIFNDHYRDQNLQNSKNISSAGINNPGNGPDNQNLYTLLKRGKRKDYFTAALPFLQKGTAVSVPLGTSAPILTSSNNNLVGTQANPITFRNVTTGTLPGSLQFGLNNSQGSVNATAFVIGGGSAVYPSNLYADLTAATAATVNTVRVAIATQQLLERDARGGTRYNETVYAHWAVRVPDFRLQRPEYLGGGSVPVLVNAIPQTSATGLTGGTTPAGNLAATGFAEGNVGFSYATLEHGYIHGFCIVRGDLTYSQGLARHWSRTTRYDYPYPEFAHLGEQAILNKEIYAIGSATGGVTPGDQDMNVWGYIPRYDECRHFPSRIAGIFRPRAAGNIAYWHSSENFTTLPVLGDTFIQDNLVNVLDRNFAAGSAAQGQQFLCDFLFTGRAVKPLPAHAVPGLTRF